MAGRLLALSAARAACRVRLVPSGACGAHDNRALIGNREIVGYGFNGEPTYIDRSDYPMPAIRWKEPTPEITVSSIKCKKCEMNPQKSCNNDVIKIE